MFRERTRCKLPRTSDLVQIIRRFPVAYDAILTSQQVILCEKYELQQMLRQKPSFGGQRGTIVNTASIAGYCIIPTASPYAASKHAVVALTRCDALRHAQDAIRINCVSPGAVWTPMLSDGGLPKEFIELGAAMAPMKRYLQPIEVANAILFLASPKASAISGINLPVDCGTQLLRSI
jgi:NAD(P)-dependent dehydrogenase (short-subunit alcohol dehydrogenase family)